MASYLAACVHLNNSAWPQRPRLCRWHRHIQQDSWDHTLFLHSSVMQLRWQRTPPHFPVLCWLKRKVAALCGSSPSNWRLNDVCSLKRPPARRCCSDQPFICGWLSHFLHSWLFLLSGAVRWRLWKLFRGAQPTLHGPPDLPHAFILWHCCHSFIWQKIKSTFSMFN